MERRRTQGARDLSQALLTPSLFGYPRRPNLRLDSASAYVMNQGTRQRAAPHSLILQTRTLAHRKRFQERAASNLPFCRFEVVRLGMMQQSNHRTGGGRWRQTLIRSENRFELRQNLNFLYKCRRKGWLILDVGSLPSNNDSKLLERRAHSKQPLCLSQNDVAERRKFTDGNSRTQSGAEAAAAVTFWLLAAHRQGNWLTSV